LEKKMLDYVGKEPKRKIRDRAGDIDKIVGMNIRLLRTSRGMSMEQFGAMLDISGQQMSKVELGINKLPLHRAVEICWVFGIDMATLLQGTGAYADDDIKPKDVMPALSVTGMEMARIHDAIPCEKQKTALRNMGRTMAQAED
jgi:transcriptional regulator with XRE-family HTH domain